MAYNITSPARRRNIRKAIEIMDAEPTWRKGPTDNEILEANAAGLEAAQNADAAEADNPYYVRALREAWLEGFANGRGA